MMWYGYCFFFGYIIEGENHDMNNPNFIDCCVNFVGYCGFCGWWNQLVFDYGIDWAVFGCLEC